jgi:small subunit ribosomal protein S13
MARIAGVDLPTNKRIDVALTYIFGIGPTRAKRIIEKTQVDPSLLVKDLGEGEIQRLAKAVNEIGKIEGDLRREVTMHIKRLMDIGCYRGLRHRRGLPVRGQRTRTNARTRKGKKKTVGRGKKKVGKKG